MMMMMNEQQQQQQHAAVVFMEEEDANELRLGEDFNDAECLTMADVYAALKEKKDMEEKEQEQQQQQQHLHHHDTVGGATDMGRKVRQEFYEHCERFGRFHNQEVLKQVKAKMERRGLRPFEVAQLINLHPEDGEEAQALIPSLKAHDEHEITELMQELTGTFSTGMFGEGA